MTSSLPNIEHLLLSTAELVEEQEKTRRQRGEHFNIFSILGMESRENETHSAFIGELLNPHGSHYFGSCFLAHFLNTIDYNGNLDTNSAQLVLEKSVGVRDDIAKEGGRIDIYIHDDLGHSVSIENKIYATDQYAQIERYANHNKENNTVYYLTLTGVDATSSSAGDLTQGEDYYAISYESTIRDWLEACLEEVSEQPILRESIKQYIILIKKLTNQPTDPKMEKELIDLIANNYEAAKLVEANLRKVEISVAEEFLLELKTRIAKVCAESKWQIQVSDNLENSYQGLTMRSTDWPEKIIIKLEGQSIIPYHNVTLGIKASKRDIDRDQLLSVLDPCGIREQGYNKESHYWPYYEYVLAWRNEEKRAELFDAEKREVLLQNLTDRLIWLAKNCNAPLTELKHQLGN